MEKIFVTGGAGFIGHNIVRYLELMNYNVSSIDNFTNYGFIPKEELNYLISHRLQKTNSKPMEYDIRGAENLLGIMKLKQPNIVIHTASYPRQKIVNTDPEDGSSVMMTGLINLLEASVKCNVKRFVYISSSMVYGNFHNAIISEQAPCNPIGQYGIMKLAGEWLVKDYAKRTGMEYTIIRPSAVYGEWDVKDRVVSQFISRAIKGEVLTVNGANEVLDFTYVEDTAKGIAQAATSENTVNKTYNITRSGTESVTLGQAAKLAVEIAQTGQINIADRDMSFPSRGRLSIDAAQKDFGYNPQVDVREGFQKYYDWYKQHPTLLK